MSSLYRFTTFHSHICTSLIESVRWRTGSSARWLERQRNDVYSRDSHRSRAYFKLQQLDEKYRIFSKAKRNNAVVLDLGCAPGSWSEYAVNRMGVENNSVIGVDLLPVPRMQGATFFRGDVRDRSICEQMEKAMAGREVSLVLSDMAPNTSGDSSTDHFRSLELCQFALGIASEHLNNADGIFICKLFRGKHDQELLDEAKEAGFKKLQWVKPPASRQESKEVFLVASDLIR
jgi:23S rRNA (uridine2552-2'-O)-methyltransferase